MAASSSSQSAEWKAPVLVRWQLKDSLAPCFMVLLIWQLLAWQPASPRQQGLAPSKIVYSFTVLCNIVPYMQSHCLVTFAILVRSKS